MCSPESTALSHEEIAALQHVNLEMSWINHGDRVRIPNYSWRMSVIVVRDVIGAKLAGHTFTMTRAS